MINVLQEFGLVNCISRSFFVFKVDDMGIYLVGDYFFNIVKSIFVNEEDIVCIDFDQFLFWVFVFFLWWDIDISVFQYFQYSLLYVFIGDIVCDRRVVVFVCYFIDFVNVYNVFFSGCYVIVIYLQQLVENVFYIFFNVVGFCEYGSINYGEGYIQEFCNGFSQQGFVCVGLIYKDDVGFFDFNIIIVVLLQVFVVVINCYGKKFFGFVLFDDIFIEVFFDFLWCDFIW